MRLSRRALDAYNAAIKKQGDNAENAARKALEVWFEENPDATVAEAREFSIALMGEVGSFYGNAAGDIAYALRDMTAEAAGVELPTVDYEYAPEAEYVGKAAHYQAGKLVDGDRPGFVDGIASSSRYFAERGANDTITALGQADGKRLGKRVRFARVPTGATNCPYCLMLASRGFVYKSELSALNANHPNCDCRIVEGFDGMEVEGYDQDYYLDCYAHPDDHPEIRDAINARRRELYAEKAEERAYSKIYDSISDIESLRERRRSLRKEASDRYDRYFGTRDESERARLYAEGQALDAEASRISKELSRLEDAQSKLIRRVVGNMRQLGPEQGKSAADYFDMQYASAVSQMVEDALPYLPRDWLDTMAAGGVRVRTLSRYAPERTYYDPGDNTLYIKAQEDKLTVVHEMMHAMDENSQAFFDDSKDFFERRTQGRQLRKLSDITGITDYKDYEVAYDMGGQCIDPYAFKEYRNPATGELYAFEVASVGVEYLYRSPMVFVNDPDHLRFVLHKLKEV